MSFIRRLLVKCHTKIENDAFPYTIRLEHRDDILARLSQIQSFYDLSELADEQVINYLRRVMNLSPTGFTIRAGIHDLLETSV